MLKCRNEKQAETEKVEDACVIRRRREVSGNTMIILSAFVVYLLFMIVIGVVYMKKTNNSEDYFLGGRGLRTWPECLGCCSFSAGF